MASSLVHHEPGWRLPRLTALARRYNVSLPEVDAAVSRLAERHLVRRLPDGQIYRTSPAEYRVSLDGLSLLSAQVDPMGGQLARQTCQSVWRTPPADISRSLGLADGARALVTRCLWTVGKEPAALAASFLPQSLALRLGVAPPSPVPAEEALENVTSGDGTLAEGATAGTAPLDGGNGAAAGSVLWPWQPPPEVAARARALQIDLALPPRSAARTLRLTPAELVLTVTASLADPVTRTSLALTRAVLRAELFRIILEAGGAEDGGTAAGLPTAWTCAAEDSEP
jgi:hypothetical protein